jgi:restriction system protein
LKNAWAANTATLPAGSGTIARTVNPRYIEDLYRFCLVAELLSMDGMGIHRITERGVKFRDEDASLLRTLDEDAAIPELLEMLSTKQRARIHDLMTEWSAFMRRNSALGSESSMYTSLRQRLHNLAERGYVERMGNVFEITPQGLAYAATGPRRRVDPQQQVLKAIKEYNFAMRKELRERLAVMHPYLFEQLVSDLLAAMGYEDVEVTQQSGDKGVDVVASVQFGITTITEVVQVKRTQGSIGRPVLDQLRGALPYHKAIRGTIITLGTFSKGCTDVALFPGAPPIGLIDGEKLLDLLIEHQIGIQQQMIPLFQIEADRFEMKQPVSSEAGPLEGVLA